jgi:hypothetical protein
MSKRENERRKGNLRFSGNDIVLTSELFEKLMRPIDIVYYLMDHQVEETFVLLLIQAEEIALESLLDSEKRETDILFEIDEKQSVYAMLCQDTKVDGGYRFAERIIKKITEVGGKDIYCSELEVRSTSYAMKTVILKLVETFIRAKKEGRSGEIIYKSLN